MHEMERSALVPFEAEAMFDLVADVEAYSDFLPWCASSAINAAVDSTTAENEMLATVEFALAGFGASFTTRNTLSRPTRIDMQLADGPFQTLEGKWQISPLGQDGCKLTLSLVFEFSNPIKDKLLSPVFEQVCNAMVDAFVQRANDLYGND